VGCKARRTHDGDGLVHEAGISDDPLKGLHASHGDAHDSFEVMDAEHASQQLVLRLDQVANGDAREPHAWLQTAVGGRRGNTIAEPINRDHEGLVGVGKFVFDDGLLKLRSGAAAQVGNRIALDLAGLSLP